MQHTVYSKGKRLTHAYSPAAAVGQNLHFSIAQCVDTPICGVRQYMCI